ncbi:FAD-dependent oxidoreductase [Dactylosporangium sp. CA-092794]|uniref:FAD-dependent oxidoreductase n=1 Tax=Dactylosporangium sp. CA-092794 TaxID=3239929 RepID=UPI003D912EE7
MSPTKWDREVDIIVVGGGNAGLPAAIVAHDNGAETIIVESNDFLGGLMRGSGGFMFFCCSHVQESLGIEDRIEWGVEDEMILSDFRAVPEIVRAYVEEGRQTCLWLEELGLTWAQDVRDGQFGTGVRGGRSVPRTHVAAVSPHGYYPGGAPQGQNGYAVTVVLEKAVEQRKIPVLYRHRMVQLYREPDGPVVGIKATTPTGEVNIRARRSVILANGGATTNERLVKAFDPRLVNDAVYSDGLPYMTAMGDGLIAAQDVGAGLSDMSFFCYTPIRYGSHYYSLSLSAIAGEQNIATRTGVTISAIKGGYQRIILVANDGRRYINEATAAYRNPALARDVASLPPAEYPEEQFIRTFLGLPNPKNVWAVADSVGAREMNWPIDEIAAPDPMHGRALHPDSVAVAATIEELGQRIGVDVTNMIATVRDYNKYAESGEDPEFGKPAPFSPISTAPFYAVKLNIIRHTPSGGLRINSKGQVLDRSHLWDGHEALSIDEEKVIPHLYATGEVAAFVGFRRAHRKTGPILSMGRISGRAAADEQPL